MRCHSTLCVLATVALAASMALAVQWRLPTCVTEDEPQCGDFRAPMNNAWGGAVV
ncbi:MAG: hypothetical protein R6X12_04320 [bacterium]